MIKDNKGFGLVGLIVLLIVITIISFGGWVVYGNVKNNSNTESKISTSRGSNYEPVVPSGWGPPSVYDKREFVDYSVPEYWNRGPGFRMDVEIRPVFMGVKVGLGEPLLRIYMPDENLFRHLRINEKTGFFTEYGEVDSFTFKTSTVMAEDKYPTFTYEPVDYANNMPPTNILIIKGDNMWKFSITNQLYSDGTSGYLGYCSEDTVGDSRYCEANKLTIEEWVNIIPDFIRTIKFY